jgi:hypothetical protein
MLRSIIETGLPSIFRFWLILCVTAGCSETTGFLKLELSEIFWQRDLVCVDDVRNIASFRAELECGDITIVQEFTLGNTSAPPGPGTTVGSDPFVIKELPLDVSCGLMISGLNKYGRIIVQSNAYQKIETRAGSEELAPIVLAEVVCNGTPNCPVSYTDTDDDGIPDDEELLIGTDIDKEDSDGDQVYDINELQRCCTDPADPKQVCDDQLIQSISPGFGTPGAQIHVKMDREHESISPTQLQIGDDLGAGEGTIPFLSAPMVDGSWIYGNLHPKAILGEVRFKKEEATPPSAYRDGLFAPLWAPPSLLFDLDTKAAEPVTTGPPVGLMRTAVDMASTKDGLLVLGYPGGLEGSTSPPVLLFWDRKKQNAEEQILCRHEIKSAHISDPITPVAIQADGPWSVVLIKWVSEETGKTNSGLLRFKSVTKDNACHFEQSPTLWILGGIEALAHQIERPENGNSEDLMVQVLSSGSLYRLRLDGKEKEPTLFASKMASEMKLGKDDTKILRKCSGFAYSGKESDTTYINCTVTCQGDPKCLPAAVLRLRDVSTCMDPTKTATCPQPQPAGYGSQLHGNPLVDSESGKLFIRSSKGIISAPLDTSMKFELKLFAAFPGTAPTNSVSGKLVMAPNTNYLYAINNTEIRRVTIVSKQRGPAAVTQAANLPFSVAYGGGIELLSVSTDGSVLDVGRSPIGSLLSDITSVCIKRCPECLCR